MWFAAVDEVKQWKEGLITYLVGGRETVVCVCLFGGGSGFLCLGDVGSVSVGVGFWEVWDMNPFFAMR